MCAPEPITMHAHAGRCRYCTSWGEPGIVKMPRTDGPPYALRPDHCWCMLCGQRYFVDIPNGDIVAWEMEQWQQKNDQEKSRAPSV